MPNNSVSGRDLSYSIERGELDRELERIRHQFTSSNPLFVEVEPTATPVRARRRRPTPAPPPTTTSAQTIGQAYGLHSETPEAHPDFVYPCFAGIELELEGFEGIPSTMDAWERVRDGSLRNNGIEFRFYRPLSGEQLSASLSEMELKLSSLDYSISERCSTHVHIDVRDLTMQQLSCFMACSLVFEHVLFNLFGEGRDCNTFCLTTETNDVAYNAMCKAISGEGTPERPKYVGISMYRLCDLGTVEFRMFNPCTEASQFKAILNFLFSLKKFAKESMSTPKDIIDMKMATDLRQLFVNCFGDGRYHPNLDANIERGVQTLNDCIVTNAVRNIVDEQVRSLHGQMEELHSAMETAERGLF